MHLSVMCNQKGSQGQVCFTYLYYVFLSGKLHTVAKFMQMQSSKVRVGKIYVDNFNLPQPLNPPLIYHC